MDAAGKIPAMLASALTTIIATWLPNPPLERKMNELENSDENLMDSKNSPFVTEYFEPTVENVEHIAAASAAVQSLLLAATAAGLLNYWSSGGVLRSLRILDLLGIPRNQRVLGAIFLFPMVQPESQSAQVVGSKLREVRGGIDAWSRWITISEESADTGGLLQ